jgi:hypothetical protein
MIQDVDTTLRELLVQKVPLDTSLIDVKFEMPTKEWSAGISRPTVNLFLYDLRENHELRSNQRYVTRSAGTASEQRAPVRVDLAYMITVWTADISDEHQLLGRIVTALLRYPMLPQESLKGAMQTQSRPLQAWIAQPERTPNAWDFWGNLENRMKAGLSYVVTVALEPHPAEESELVTQTTIRITETGS